MRLLVNRARREFAFMMCMPIVSAPRSLRSELTMSCCLRVEDCCWPRLLEVLLRLVITVGFSLRSTWAGLAAPESTTLISFYCCPAARYCRWSLDWILVSLGVYPGPELGSLAPCRFFLGCGLAFSSRRAANYYSTFDPPLSVFAGL